MVKPSDENALFLLLKKGDSKAFEEIFDLYWERVYNYIHIRVGQTDVAFDIVQDIFVSLWIRREAIELHTSLSGYLFAMARYQIIGHIKEGYRREEYLKDYGHYMSLQFDTSSEDKVHLDDLNETIEQSIAELPPRCQEIFRMSRFQNLSIDEIASRLDVSSRTVENQLTRALKHLRTSLPDSLFIFLLLLLSRG